MQEHGTKMLFSMIWSIDLKHSDFSRLILFNPHTHDPCFRCTKACTGQWVEKVYGTDAIALLTVAFSCGRRPL